MNIRTDLLPLLKETIDKFQEDEAAQLGAALAYYAVFSIFPLLLLLVASLGWVLRSWGAALDVQEQILAAAAANTSPQLSQALGALLAGVKSEAGGATIVGLATLLLGASGVFQQLDVSFNRIWRVPRPAQTAGVLAGALRTIRMRLFAFSMVPAVGFLLLVSMALSALARAPIELIAGLPVIGGAAGVALGLLISLALNALVFTLLFKFLPDTVVYWRDVWLGALVTALLWELAKHLLAWYIGRAAQSYSAYGAVGTLLVVMAWIYLSSQIVYLGAEFTEVYSRRYGSRAAHPHLTEEVAAERAEAAEAAPPPSGRKRVVVAAGAGVALGVLGALLAAVVGLALGVRRVAGRVARLRRRG